MSQEPIPSREVAMLLDAVRAAEGKVLVEAKLIAYMRACPRRLIDQAHGEAAGLIRDIYGFELMKHNRHADPARWEPAWRYMVFKVLCSILNHK